ncbi:cell division protein ZapA [Rhizobium sp. S95]|uniref:Cell division protein ZapA n=1 Tax=Ciceribacter sichuanensis TaxID=2949647 RepID=A0AAJ1F8Y4_9HYPH|nr:MULTISPECIES: cell division protein ZapA [unclassified Ciceribacter]MCM2398547.1 cell division protein ZapA [Ciceribacter sp. S95]MCO5958553.1 cell division protein ZapA [Ciceribacter sp. S101]
MAQVTVTIDGKAYRMACDEGQEDHLIDLATQFDRYVNHLKTQFGEIGDLRVTVMAGIMIMDELSELNRRIAALEGEVATFRSGQDAAMTGARQREEMLTQVVGELTERLNGITRKLTARPSVGT